MVSKHEALPYACLDPRAVIYTATSLTSWCKGLLEKLIIFQPVKIFFAFYGTLILLWFLDESAKYSYPEPEVSSQPILILANPFNIIHISISRSSSGLFPSSL